MAFSVLVVMLQGERVILTVMVSALDYIRSEGSIMNIFRKNMADDGEGRRGKNSLSPFVHYVLARFCSSFGMFSLVFVS